MKNINGEEQVGNILKNLARHWIFDMAEFFIVLIHLNIVHIEGLGEIVLHTEDENLTNAEQLFLLLSEILLSVLSVGSSMLPKL